MDTDIIGKPLRTTHRYGLWIGPVFGLLIGGLGGFILGTHMADQTLAANMAPGAEV